MRITESPTGVNSVAVDITHKINHGKLIETIFFPIEESAKFTIIQEIQIYREGTDQLRLRVLYEMNGEFGPKIESVY